MQQNKKYTSEYRRAGAKAKPRTNPFDLPEDVQYNKNGIPIVNTAPARRGGR